MAVLQLRSHADYQPVLFDTLRRMRNGYISIIKQDNRIVQINVCHRITTAEPPADQGPALDVLPKIPAGRAALAFAPAPEIPTAAKPEGSERPTPVQAQTQAAFEL
jgi:hypothetical protein